MYHDLIALTFWGSSPKIPMENTVLSAVRVAFNTDVVAFCLCILVLYEHSQY